MTALFTGYGKSTFAVVNDLSSMFLIRVPATYLISQIAGVTLFQIGLAGPISNLISIMLCVIYFKFGKWNKTNISRIE